MKPCVLALVLAAFATAADTSHLVYTKAFPGSLPAYVSIALDHDGSVAYKEAVDDDAENFKIEPESAATMFDLAAKLDHFKNPLESNLKVAFMGQKTFRWEDGAEKREVKFNYSQDENARALQDWFERITETEGLAIQLRRAIRYDKLGVNDAVLKIHASWDRKRLVGLPQLIPLLDRVAQNETFINIARERARGLAEAFRAASHIPAAQ